MTAVLAMAQATGARGAAGFTGPQEVEIFSALDWWKRPGDEVLRTCIERYWVHCL